MASLDPETADWRFGNDRLAVRKPGSGDPQTADWRFGNGRLAIFGNGRLVIFGNGRLVIFGNGRLAIQKRPTDDFKMGPFPNPQHTHLGKNPPSRPPQASITPTSPSGYGPLVRIGGRGGGGRGVGGGGVGRSTEGPQEDSESGHCLPTIQT